MYSTFASIVSYVIVIRNECMDLLAHCDCKKCTSICICSCRSIVSSVSAPIKNKSSLKEHDT